MRLMENSDCRKRSTTILLCLFVLLVFGNNSFAQPANDSCSRAIEIVIPSGGFGLGNFTAAPADMTSATVQAGETFAPAIFVAALNKKSVWYKFSIPTIRAVRVTLSQPGTTITAGDVGFAVYEASTCLPGNAQISTKLTPIVTFGNTYHPCVPSGEYYIQVSSNNNANGPINIQVEISDQTGAPYDHPSQAYAFGQVKYYAQKIDFNSECQSIEDSSEVCNGFANPREYNKSAWFTFTTPAYFDYIVVQLSSTSYYFPSNNNQPIKRRFGYSLYQGNAVSTPIGSLTLKQGCDSIETDGYYAAYKMYKCSDLLPNTTYSIQLFIKKDFIDDVRLGILVGGQVPTKGPKPSLANVPAPNAIGNLAASPNGTQTTIDDVWGCNSRHGNPSCGPAVPDSGIAHSGRMFNLSSFFTFTLTTTCAVNFNGHVTQCGPQPLVRVFKQGLTTDCSQLDTSKIIGVFNQHGTIDCLEPGEYTVQVSGQDVTDWWGRFNVGTPNYNAEQCLSNNLGASFRLNLNAYTRKDKNRYSLATAGAVDSINDSAGVMRPLMPGVGYMSTSDTIGCKETLRPADTTCHPTNDKVIYREFAVADSGVVDFSNLANPWSGNWKYKVYKGDASALASAQNVFAYPDRIHGLHPMTECMNGWTDCTNKRVCVLPGTYTFTSMGNDEDVGRVDQPRFTFLRTRTKHDRPETAQDLGSIMDTLGPAGGAITTDIDYWGCRDNAVAIYGVQPCLVGGKTATKAIYRQFYLKEDALVRIENTSYWWCSDKAYGTKNLFYGKATDGIAGLTPVGGQWSCFSNAGSTAGCELLKAGWYTVVSYNQGPSYDSTMRNLNLEGRYNSSVSYQDEYRVIVTPSCRGPRFNRPHKAARDSSGQPFMITWGDRYGSTIAYPKRDSAYTLPAESFNCTVDTPFNKHPIAGCQPSSNRVAYYVFKTTQVSFLQINTGGYYAVVYDKDIRNDSSLFTTIKPIQTCNNSAGYIQFCHFQPGTYTLVIFAGDGDVCKSVTPVIYIDEVGKSRFDFASNAYDFGVVPADSVFHYGKVGDVNPVDTGRKPASDIFYCTTGATDTDPTHPVCYTTVNPNVYNSGPNKSLYDSIFPPSKGITRRNIWFTFVVDQPGYVRVKVEPKTLRHAFQQKFAVYRSDVDGTLPYSTVVSTGKVDSTMAQGLTHIVTNQQNWYYCANLYNDVVFYRDPCNNIPTRYYILVENVNAEPYEAGGTLPNTQADVSIMVDSINLVLPKHDHYFQAGDIGTVGVGKYTGDTDNYSCATKNPKDPLYHYSNEARCQKTLWYKFTSTITGNVRYRIYVNGVRKNDYWDVQLFKEIIPGDSTTTGLQIQGYQGVSGSDNTYWSQACVSRGTYYLILTGCDQVGAYAYPEIELIEAAGDFCDRAVTAALNGPGNLSAMVSVNCHTIGTDYGEFAPQVTCPQGGITGDYKSSWFRMDIGGMDTLDVTTYLVENTNAASSDIKYRMMTGDCGAMQEQSCVLDALTQNTYQCLVPGQSYYVQVFTPITKFSQQVTGTIELKLLAVPHVDTCAPDINCLSNANFIPQFDCTKDTAVRFVNYSTFGSSIRFNWDFDHSGKTSTEVSPSFEFPALPTAQTYNVKLRVQNLACNGNDSVIVPVTIPARPSVELGRDTVVCNNSDTVVLNATTWAGAVYQWNTGAITPTIKAFSPGINKYSVKVIYNNCVRNDTITVYKNPLTARKESSTICNSDSVQLNSQRSQGETYLWNTGSTNSSIYASQPALYVNNINWNGCIIPDSFTVNRPLPPLGGDTAVCLIQPFTLQATTPGATGYQWQNGSGAPSINVSAPGTYWVQVNFSNCQVRDTIEVSSLTPFSMSVDTIICEGSSLMLPSGKIVNGTGQFLDTLKSQLGCDSLISNFDVQLKTLIRDSATATICAGETYIMPSGIILTSPGTFYDTLRYASGCDSLRFTAVLTLGTVRVSSNAQICQGQSFMLPSGKMVSIGGTYIDTLQRNAVCDSIITTTLAVRSVNEFLFAPILCSGQTYTLPSGKTVNTTGVYHDTLRYVGGCDSVRTIVDLKVRGLLNRSVPAAICEGGSYTLPSGKTVNIGGTYYDTVRYTDGCDSLRSTVLLTVNSLSRASASAVVCQGQNYTLPSGRQVSLPGTYSDTLRYVNGCDSVITTAKITVKALTRTSTSATICEGETYTLPGGRIVSTAGNFSDTLRYPGGCDSLITNVLLAVKTITRTNSTASVCEGQQYALPSGKLVTVAGTYRDTLRYNNGCDSLLSTIVLSVSTVTRSSASAIICQGQNYTLPSGKQVSLPGTYSDTLRYVNGCDSMITTAKITVKASTRTSTSATICEGQTYTLPGGRIVSTAGSFSDTLRYAGGCDSLITNVTLAVKTITRTNSTASVCEGQQYALPSGRLVNVAGTYRDTLRYINGCDSILSTIVLSVNAVARTSASAVLCQGQNYTLPSGRQVSLPGTYSDTLRYIDGCDSLVTKATIIVKALTRTSTSATICDGQTYPLPSGRIVSTAGNFRDTLRYAGGCDSLITNVMLTVKTITRTNSTASVCQGQQYALPSGKLVSVAGTYRDTLRYNDGCDSILSTIVLSVNAVIRASASAVICQGQNYTLPSGRQVTLAGVYSDTTKYISGCDSIITTFTLAVKPLMRNTISAAICPGTFYKLPSGRMVSTTGTYNDTLRFATGCDSLITILSLVVKQPAIINSTPSICDGETYMLPSGTVVNSSGYYREVVKDITGCDSLVHQVSLTVNPLPVVTVSKSNDINCLVGTSTLSATGGRKYQWSPIDHMNNPNISNPVVSPQVSTSYSVNVTSAAGCVSSQSMMVAVNRGDADGGYQLPSAFTPNADGKNDCFGVKAWGYVSNLEMYVYDRWGNAIFATTDPATCWDGSFKGAKMSTGAYIYFIKANTICGPVTRKGTIVLIR